MDLLNLGCGSRFHPDWTNIEFYSSNDHVRAYDLYKDLPFPDNSFDVVYYSHLLEHFPKDKAFIFMRECFRVLKPGCIIRVVVPDLEQIVKLYLTALGYALEGKEEWRKNYDWIMLELYDQAVREKAGGGMLEYFKQNSVPNESFVLQRIGDEAKNIIQSLKDNQSREKEGHYSGKNLPHAFSRFYKRIREHLTEALLGNTDFMALQAGRFRSKGEVHRWMYDRYSLSLLLTRSGFLYPTVQTAWDSKIKDWSSYNLDTNPDGSIYKPDSIYMEAIKP